MTDEKNNPEENPQPHESTAKFGLNEPTGQFQDLKDLSLIHISSPRDRG